MRYTKTIYIDPEEIAELEEILAIESGHCNRFRKEEIIAIYNIHFENDFEADIEVCNDDPPCVKGTLYQPVEEEEEIVLYEVDDIPFSKSLIGEHLFEYEGNTYVAVVSRSL